MPGMLRNARPGAQGRDDGVRLDGLGQFPA